MSSKENFIFRFVTYLNARFPLYQMLPLAAVLSLSCSVVAQFVSKPSSFGTIPYLISFIALLLFLFHLRIFDEFKDFDHDRQFYPERPVPKGVVTLSELQKLGFVVIGLELILSFYRGATSVILYLIILGYSLLMLKEFFVREWLREHFTIYIISHEIMAVPLFYYVYALNLSNFIEISNPALFAHAIFQTATLFLLEVARKIRPKGLEISSKDTYTAQYGILGASALLIFLATTTIVSKSLIGYTFFSQIPKARLLLDLLFSTLLFASIVNFIRLPTKISAKTVFLTAAIFSLGVNLSFIFSLWSKL